MLINFYISLITKRFFRSFGRHSDKTVTPSELLQDINNFSKTIVDVIRKSYEFSFKIVLVITIVVSNHVNFRVNARLWRQSIASWYSITSRFSAILLFSPPSYILYTLAFTFSFSFVLVCLVIIDPVQQGDAQLSHPLCQVSAVHVTVWCSGLAIWCVVMYLMVWRFALNRAESTTVHTRLGTSICVTSWPAHLVDCLPSVHLGGSWMCLLSYCWLHPMAENSRLL